MKTYSSTNIVWFIDQTKNNIYADAVCKVSFLSVFSQAIFLHTAKNQYQKFETHIPRKGIHKWDFRCSAVLI